MRTTVLIGIASVLFLLSMSGGALAVRVAFQDGSVMEADSYEIKDGMVLLWKKGELYSYPAARMDLAKTEALNAPQAGPETKATPEAAPAAPSPTPAARKTPAVVSYTPITNEMLEKLVGKSPAPASEAKEETSASKEASDARTEKWRKEKDEEEKQAREEAGKLEQSVEELTKTVAGIDAEIRTLQGEWQREDDLIRYMISTSGNTESIGGNVWHRAQLESQIQEKTAERNSRMGDLEEAKRQLRFLPTAP